jgi:hypothetical protein
MFIFIPKTENTDMPAGRPKGIPKSGGRKPGVVNKYTLTVKQGVLEAFQKVNSDPKHPANLNVFALVNPVEFNKIAARLIPTEVNATVTEVKLSVNRKKGEASQTPAN